VTKDMSIWKASVLILDHPYKYPIFPRIWRCSKDLVDSASSVAKMIAVIAESAVIHSMARTHFGGCFTRGTRVSSERCPDRKWHSTAWSASASHLSSISWSCGGV
jgi:hypothetical protein